GQTSETETDLKYVYAYNTHSNSNKIATSSSSYGISTNENAQNLDKKKKSRITNESSDFFQYNLSSQSNFFNSIDKPETVNESDTYSSVKIYPIICWNAIEQKYIFSNPNEWPSFPHKAKVVGFIGTKKSGRTTAIHSLLFELGYSLTGEQIAKSLLPVGVMMYVLKKHDLIFLDCCDVADSATDEGGNL
ncbi:6406_t:CDS:1, partial [Cetraspora pellucida]